MTSWHVCTPLWQNKDTRASEWDQFQALPPWPGLVAEWSSPDAAPRQAIGRATSAGDDPEAGLGVEQVLHVAALL